jgi:AGZA family xanthine/uracil permease-like MFS transporter
MSCFFKKLKNTRLYCCFVYIKNKTIMPLLEKLSLENQSYKIKDEFFAGLINYLTCAYITVINPMILSEAKIIESDVFLATCITIGITCIFLAFRTKLPIIVGPTSAINTYFLVGITGNLGLTWQQGLAATFISGLIIYFLAYFKFREKIAKAIPISLTAPITYGIGVFLLLISISYSGMYNYDGGINLNVNNIITFSLATIVTIIAKNRNIPGSSVLGIVAATIIYIALEKVSIPYLITIPEGFKSSLGGLSFHHIYSAPNLTAIFAITIIVLLDSNASFNALMKALHKNDSSCSKPLEGVGLATIIGSLLGTSSSGVYLESLSGISAGGKTGLCTLVTGILFLITIFLSPLVHIIPNAATTAILFTIAISILKEIKFISSLKWHELIPAVLVIITIPIRFSIVDGIGAGLLSYTLINIIFRKLDNLNPYLISMNLIFLCFFWVKYTIATGIS